MCADKNASPADRFIDNMSEFIKAFKMIVSSLNEDGLTNINTIMIDATCLIIKAFDRHTMISTFVSGSYKHWNEIWTGNSQFFIDHAFDLFGDLPTDSVDQYHRLFRDTDDYGDPLIDDKQRETIIKYFKSFVRISIAYIHDYRRPKSCDVIIRDIQHPDGKTKAMQVRVWTYDDHSNNEDNMLYDLDVRDIDLTEQAAIWDITLL